MNTKFQRLEGVVTAIRSGVDRGCSKVISRGARQMLVIVPPVEWRGIKGMIYHSFMSPHEWVSQYDVAAEVCECRWYGCWCDELETREES